MSNRWSDLIRLWGQAAIDETILLIDTPGRESLFDSVFEGLSAKEHTTPVHVGDFSHAVTSLVLLPLSGGLDSLVAYERALEAGYEVRPFYVHLNTPYAKNEMRALNELAIDYEVIDYSSWPQRWEPYKTSWAHILPQRNLLIIMSIAESEGGRPGAIWLGATDGEIPAFRGDKSWKFFESTTRLLATLPVSHTLDFPLRRETKSDLVLWWLKSGRDPARLLTTITCQNIQDDTPCGACHACFNRWVALTNNGLYEETIQEPYVIEANGNKIVQFEEALATHDFDTWSERRVLQTLHAWYEAWEDERLIGVRETLISMGRV